MEILMIIWCVFVIAWMINICARLWWIKKCTLQMFRDIKAIRQHFVGVKDDD